MSYLAPLSHSFRIAAVSLRILLIWLFPQLTAVAILRQDSPLSICFNTSTRSSSVRILRLPAAAILIMVWISLVFTSPKTHIGGRRHYFSVYAAERRRLSWLGHLMRLNPETPARQSFKEALRPVKRKPGRPPMTWITTIQQDLSKRDIHINLRDISAIEKLESMCHDRVGWKARCSMREPRETAPLSSVSAQHVTSDCS